VLIYAQTGFANPHSGQRPLIPGSWVRIPPGSLIDRQGQQTMDAAIGPGLILFIGLVLLIVVGLGLMMRR
jgi:hypothetical protein